MSDCPVCGMDVDDSDPPAQTEYDGETYTFCGDGCKAEFEDDPEQYA